MTSPRVRALSLFCSLSLLSLSLSFARQTTASSASIHQPHPPKPAVGIDDGGELIIHNSNDHDKWITDAYNKDAAMRLTWHAEDTNYTATQHDATTAMTGVSSTVFGALRLGNVSRRNTMCILCTDCGNGHFESCTAPRLQRRNSWVKLERRRPGMYARFSVIGACENTMLLPLPGLSAIMRMDWLTTWRWKGNHEVSTRIMRRPLLNCMQNPCSHGEIIVEWMLRCHQPWLGTWHGSSNCQKRPIIMMMVINKTGKAISEEKKRKEKKSTSRLNKHTEGWKSLSRKLKDSINPYAINPMWPGYAENEIQANMTRNNS